MKIIDDTRYERDERANPTIVPERSKSADAEDICVGDIAFIFYTVGGADEVRSQAVVATDVIPTQKVDGDAVVLVSWSFTDEETRFQTITVEYDPYDKVTIFWC